MEKMPRYPGVNAWTDGKDAAVPRRKRLG